MEYFCITLAGIAYSRLVLPATAAKEP